MFTTTAHGKLDLRPRRQRVRRHKTLSQQPLQPHGSPMISQLRVWQRCLDPILGVVELCCLEDHTEATILEFVAHMQGPCAVVNRKLIENDGVNRLRRPNLDNHIDDLTWANKIKSDRRKPTNDHITKGMTVSFPCPRRSDVTTTLHKSNRIELVLLTLAGFWMPEAP